MNIRIDGKLYQIGGIAFGAVPVWQLIRQDGVAMTQESFTTLPAETQKALVELAQQHMDEIKKTSDSTPSSGGFDASGFDVGGFDTGVVSVVPSGIPGYGYGGYGVAGAYGSILHSVKDIKTPHSNTGPLNEQGVHQSIHNNEEIISPVLTASTGLTSESFAVSNNATVLGATGSINANLAGLEGVAAEGLAANLDGSGIVSTAGQTVSGEARIDIAPFTSDGRLTVQRPRRTADELDQIIKSLIQVRDVVEIAQIASIGHNGPPEAIDVPPLNIEDVDAAISVSNVFRSQLSEHDTSDLYIIDACEDVFGALGKRIGQFLAWLKRFPSKMWDSVIEKAPEWTAKALFWEGATVVVETLRHMLSH